jgi:hypothetical protein
MHMHKTRSKYKGDKCIHAHAQSKTKKTDAEADELLGSFGASLSSNRTNPSGAKLFDPLAGQISHEKFHDLFFCREILIQTVRHKNCKKQFHDVCAQASGSDPQSTKLLADEHLYMYVCTHAGFSFGIPKSQASSTPVAQSDDDEPKNKAPATRYVCVIVCWCVYIHKYMCV